MANNLLNSGVSALEEVEKDLTSRDSMSELLLGLQGRLASTESAIAQEEKDETEEIEATIKQRRGALSATFAKQLNDLRAKQKKAASERSKNKESQMDSRIKDETAYLKEQNKDLEKQLKKHFKEEKAPGICRSRFFYYMYMPRGGEIVKTILYFILFVAVIPVGAGFATKLLMEMNDKIGAKYVHIGMIAIPAVLLILFLLIYFIIYIRVKMRHLDAVKEGRTLRTLIRKNEKEIRRIEKGIRKDKDESHYDLGEFDDELQNLKASEEQITSEQTAALKEFDEKTKLEITEDIQSKRRASLAEKKAEAEKLKTDLSATDQQLQNLSREISSKYETYLGQHCNTLAVKQLIQIMQSGRASVVSEAITILESANQVDETSLASASAAGIDVTPNVVTGSGEEASSGEGTSSDEAN